MSNSSKKKQFGMNIGSASILLVFVILCLISFSVLSIVSANAGMDKTLQRIYASSESKEAYFTSVGHGKSYVIPISDLQSLQVTIEILYPVFPEDTFYRITAWQVLNTDEL